MERNFIWEGGCVFFLNGCLSRIVSAVSLIVRGESGSRINKQGVCLTKKKEGCWSYMIYFIL